MLSCGNFPGWIIVTWCQNRSWIRLLRSIVRKNDRTEQNCTRRDTFICCTFLPTKFQISDMKKKKINKNTNRQSFLCNVMSNTRYWMNHQLLRQTKNIFDIEMIALQICTPYLTEILTWWKSILNGHFVQMEVKLNLLRDRLMCFWIFLKIIFN